MGVYDIMTISDVLVVYVYTAGKFTLAYTYVINITYQYTSDEH